MIETKERRTISSKGFVAVPSVTSIPISAIAKNQKALVVSYKAKAFHEDRKNASLAAVSSFVIEQKGVPPVFNPDLEVWQCAEGTRYGGRFTDRYGRGCGGGILRRLGSALGRLSDGGLAARLNNIGERRDLRRLARYSARQSYRDDLAKIREQYPSLSRRALRRLGGTFRRVDNQIPGALPGQPAKRRLRGRNPQRSSIVARAGWSVGGGIDKLIERLVPGRRGKKPTRRVRLSERLAERRQRRAQMPKKPSVLTRIGDRAGAAYERFIDRVLYGRQNQGRRGRRGVGPGQGGQTVLLPKKPKTPRAKKKKAVVQKTKPKPAVPQKKIKKTNLIDVPNLDLVQKAQLKETALSQLDEVEAFWRKRLGIPDGDPISIDAIDAYIQERIDKGQNPAYIGMLKANRNDLIALQDFKAKLDANDPDAYEALNNIGPKRRNQLLASINALPAEKKPAPKPKKPTTPKKPKPKKPSAPEAEVVTPEAPEPQAEEIVEPVNTEDLPEVVQPEPEAADIEQPEADMPEAEVPQVDEVIEPEVEPVETEDLPEAIQPEEMPEASLEAVAEEDEQEPVIEPGLEEIVPEETPTPEAAPLPEIEDEEPLPTPIATEDLPPVLQPEDFPAFPTPEETIIYPPLAAPEPPAPPTPPVVVADGDVNIIDGFISLGPDPMEFDNTPEGIEAAIKFAKAISATLPFDKEIALVHKTNDKWAVQIPDGVDVSNLKNENVAIFSNGQVLGFVTFSKYVEMNIPPDFDPDLLIDWGSGELQKIKLPSKGIETDAAVQMFRDFRAISKVHKTDTFILAVLPESGKNAHTYIGTADQIAQKIEADKDIIGANPKYYMLGYHNAKTDRTLIFEDETKSSFFDNFSVEQKESDGIHEGTNWGTNEADVKASLSKVSKGLNLHVENLGNDAFGAYGGHIYNFINQHVNPPWPHSSAGKARFLITRNGEGLESALSPGHDAMRIRRRSPSSSASSGYRMVQVAKKYWGYSYQTTYTGDEVGEQVSSLTAIPSNFYPLYGQAADTASKSLYLIYDKGSLNPWKMVDGNRLEFLRRSGFEDKHIVLYLRRYYSHKEISYNANAFVDGSSMQLTGKQDYDDVDLFSQAFASKFPDLNFPIDTTSTESIIIDQSYVPSKATYVPMSKEAAQSLIDGLISDIDAGSNPEVEPHYQAAKVVAYGKLVGKYALTPATDADLLADLDEAKNEFDAAIQNLKDVPAGFSVHDKSHITALAAKAKLAVIESVIADNETAKLISQKSTELFESVGEKTNPVVPSLVIPNVSVAVMQIDEWKALVASTDIKTLSDTLLAGHSSAYEFIYAVSWADAIGNPAFTADNVDIWEPWLKKRGTTPYYASDLAAALEYIATYNGADGKLTAKKASNRLISAVQAGLSDTPIMWQTALTSGFGELLDYLETPAQKEDLAELEQLIDSIYSALMANDKQKLEALVAAHGSIHNAITDKVVEIYKRGNLNFDHAEGMPSVSPGIINSALVAAERFQQAYEAFEETPLLITTLQAASLVELDDDAPSVPIPDFSIATGTSVQLAAAHGQELIDVIGLMAEEATLMDEPLILYMKDGLLKIDGYDVFVADVSPAGYNSVIAAATQEGSFYIANPALTSNPNNKWISKLGKVGTGGFKTPIGAHYVFDSTELTDNLEDLYKKKGELYLTLPDDWIPGSTVNPDTFTVSQNKGQSLTSELIAPTPQNPIGNKYTVLVSNYTQAEKKERIKAGLASADSYLASADSQPNTLSIQQTLEVMNPSALMQAAKEISESGLTSNNAYLVGAFVTEKGQTVVRTFLHTDEFTFMDELEAYEGYELAFTLRVDASFINHYLIIPRVNSMRVPKETDGESLYDWFWSGKQANVHTPLYEFPNKYNTSGLYSALALARGNISKQAALDMANQGNVSKSGNSALDALHADLYGDWSTSNGAPAIPPLSTLAPAEDFDLKSLGKLDGLADTIASIDNASEKELEVHKSLGAVLGSTGRLNYLVLPYISALFDALDEAGVNYKPEAVQLGSSQFDGLHKISISGSSYGSGHIIGLLKSLSDSLADDANSGLLNGLTPEQFLALFPASDSPIGLRENAKQLYTSIKLLAGGHPFIARNFFESFNDDFDPGLENLTVTPDGIDFSKLSLSEKLDLLKQANIEQNKRVSAILDNPDFQKLNPTAKNLALVGEQSRHLALIQAVAAVISAEQKSGNPTTAATLRSALKSYINLSPVTPTIAPSTIKVATNWLDAGGYPKITPAPKVLAAVPNQPVFGLGNYNAGILGTVSDGGIAVAHHVPAHAEIPDLPSAVAHLEAGGLLSEVPDVFLADAITANLGQGKRFLIDESIKGGYNGSGVWGFFDVHDPDPTTGEYRRYVHKLANRNASEHINEIMGSQIEHQLGLFAVGHRVAGLKSTPTDKYGEKSAQRPIIQEHIANLFLGSGWKAKGSFQKVKTGEKIDPENLGKFVALTRIINHFDRTGANVFVMRDKEGRLHLVPIDDGNAFYEFGKGQKGAGGKALPDKEQELGFIGQWGHNLDWFAQAQSMGDEDKLAFAVSLRETVDRFMSLDLNAMELQILEAFPWDDDEVAHIKDRYQVLKDRRSGRNWEQMLTKAYDALGISEADVTKAVADKKASKTVAFEADEEFSSPTSAFYKLTQMSKRNLGSRFLWDGDKIERQEMTVAEAVLADDPFGTPDGTTAVVANFRLDGDAKDALAQIKDGENGWKELKDKNGSPIKKPLILSYKQAGSNKKIANKRRFSLTETGSEIPGGGQNFIKQLDDGTVIVAYRHTGSHAFANTVFVYKPSESPDQLSIPDFDSVVESALSEFGIDSAVPTKEVLYERAMKDLLGSLKGKAGVGMWSQPISEIEAELAKLGFTATDLEMAIDQNGNPYIRLTKEARTNLIKKQNRRALVHRYSHSHLGAKKGFINTIFSGSLGSTVRRFNNGMPFGGWSSGADTNYTSAKWTFWHFADGKISTGGLLLDEGLSDSDISGVLKGGSGGFKSYMPIEFAIETPTMRFTTHDRLGNPEYHVGFLEASKDQYTGSAEPMVYDAVSVSKMLHVVEDSEYQSVIDELKALGVNDVDGIPIEVLIIKGSSSRAEAFKKLRQYWKDLGWIE